MQLCFFQQEVSQKDPPDKKRSPLFWEGERERETQCVCVLFSKA